VVKALLLRILALVIAALSVCIVNGQNKPRLDCPGVRLLASDEAVTEGDKVTFHVELMGGNIDRSELNYEWQLAHGKGRILSGQGTQVIVVSTSGVGSTGSVTATANIYHECDLTTSETVYVRRSGERTKADEFWEWLWINGARVQFADIDETAAMQAEIRERLVGVDPHLTVDIGSRSDDGKREIIVGWVSKPYNSKAVTEFVSRAPNFLIYKIVFQNSAIDYPPR
jgi:hypothetical protein